MELKFPKSIKIGASKFKITYDKGMWGGNVNYYDEKEKTALIVIGTKHLKEHPLRILTTIIHELKEIIQIEQGTRYNETNNEGEYLFSYNHKQHTDFCERLTGLLEEFIK